jgi:hypothetical protein
VLVARRSWRGGAYQRDVSDKDMGLIALEEKGHGGGCKNARAW